MADFVAVLRKTISGLGENTPEMREKVFSKARSTIEAKLAAIDPPPPAAVAERQRRALEDAIVVVKAEYEDTADDDDGDALEDVFATLQRAPAPAAGPVFTAATPVVAAPVRPTASDETAGASRGGSPDDAMSAESVGEPRPIVEDTDIDGSKRQDAPDADRHRDDLVAATGVAGATAAGGSSSTPDVEEVVFPESAPAGVRGTDDARQRGAGGFSRFGIVAALVALLVVAGGGYGLWLNRDDLGGMFGQDVASDSEAQEPAVTAEDLPDEPIAGDQETGTEEQAAADEPAPAEPDAEDAAAAEDASDETPEVAAAEVPATAPSSDEPQKFTQRLLPDGSEVDAGPAGGTRRIGEGTSIASAQAPEPGAEPLAADPEAPAAENGDSPTGTPEQPAGVAVGQRAIFYEERTSAAQGSAETGSIVWSVVQESPGGDLPPEPAIRAEASIPAMDVQLRMTIRRNGDPTLPASHIIEMIFLTPDGFGGGGIENVSRIAFKESEQSAGTPLIGIPARIADGFFLIALSNSAAEIDANTTLLRRQSWIDIPLTYASGRRALVTLEKGIPGDRVFEEALRAWDEASSG